MGNVVFIVKEINDNYRVTEFNDKKDKDENIKNINELKILIFKYGIGDLLIHDISLSVYNPNLQKTKATTINVIDAFGCNWKSFLAKYSFEDFVNLGVDSFSKSNLEIKESSPIFEFHQEVDKEFKKRSFFGSAADYHQYTFNFSHFYDFLSKQYFPDMNSLSEKPMIVDTLNKNSYAKFILSLNLYEGFVICSSLITDEIQLDEVNIFNNCNEVIIPFNLFKYLIKYKNINELYILKYYVSVKKELVFNENLNEIEKLITIGGLSERSDIFTKLYVRYYFFIYALKYFSEDIVSIDLKRKIIHTYNKNIKTSLFSYIK